MVHGFFLCRFGLCRSRLWEGLGFLHGFFEGSRCGLCRSSCKEVLEVVHGFFLCRFGLCRSSLWDAASP